MSSPSDAGPLSSNSGTVGHIFSGFSKDCHFSNASHEQHSEKDPFISQTSVRVHSSCLPVPGVLQSTSSSCYTMGNNYDSWCSDMLPGFLDYPMTARGNSHTDGGNNSSCVGQCEDFSMPSGLLDQLLNSDDALTSNWDHTENNGFVNSQLQFPYQVPTLSMDHTLQPPQVHQQPLPHQHSQVYQQLPQVHEQFPPPSKEICTAQSTSHKVQQPQIHQQPQVPQQPLALQQPQIHEELPRASDEIRTTPSMGYTLQQPQVHQHSQGHQQLQAQALQQSQVHHQLPPASTEIFTSANKLSSASSTSTRSHMRWTSKLHETFVEAVNKLGGSEITLFLLLSFATIQNKV